MPRRIVLALLPVLLAALAWWWVADATAMARLAAMALVEPYAFAAHEQLLVNFSRAGEWAQTVHRGYDDAWTWSGHRALTLPIAGQVYGLLPGPATLLRFQLAFVLLGAVPAALIGWQALRSPWGLTLGGLVYLGAPAVMALALQDYQDLVFALPCLTFALWAARSPHALVAALGTAVALLPREECVPLAIAAALVTIPPRLPFEEGPREVDPTVAGRVERWRARRLRWGRWRRLARNVFLAACIAGAYAAWMQARHPVSGQGYDMPLASALTGMIGQPDRIFLDGWPYLGSFYALLFLPLGVLALLSPLPLLPALGLVFLHLAVPEGHGVDRSFGGHAHHLAPALPFVLVATIEGAGRLLRLPRRIAIGAAAAMAVAAALVYAAWGREFNLTAGPPAFTHPAWALVERIPRDAVPIASKGVAAAVSAWPVSYTYDDSLDDKARDRGLGAGTWLLADTRQAGILDRGLAMEGALRVAEDGPFVLVRWAEGAVDRTWMRHRDKRVAKPPPYTGPFARRTDIPGVAPFESRATGGAVPRVGVPGR